MRLEAALGGNLETAIARDVAIVRKARKEAVAEVTREVQLAARDVINRRFKGSEITKNGSRRIANAIRSKIYDDGDDTGAGIIFSKFGSGRGAQFVDYLLPYVKGETIRPRRSQWLYIPLKHRRGTRRGVRVDVSQEKNVRWQPARNGKVVFIVQETRTRSTLIAVLVRAVKYERSLDFDRVAENAGEAIERRMIEKLAELERGR